MSQAPVIVPLDTSAAAERVLPLASAFAAALEAPVVLLTVVSDGVSGPTAGAQWRDVDAYLDRVRARLEAAGLSVSARVEVGQAADRIVEAAAGAALIAMVSLGRSAPVRWFLGSVSDRVLHQARVPVLLVRPGDEGPPDPSAVERVLVPLDGSELSEEAIPLAIRIARAFHARVTVSRALPMDWTFSGATAGMGPRVDPALIEAIEEDARRYLEGVAVRLRAEGLDADAHVGAFQHAAAEIAEIAAEAHDTLIVMTTHGRTGLSRAARGSVTDEVIRSSVAPVLLVRPTGLDRTPAPSE